MSRVPLHMCARVCARADMCTCDVPVHVCEMPVGLSWVLQGRLGSSCRAGPWFSEANVHPALAMSLFVLCPLDKCKLGLPKSQVVGSSQCAQRPAQGRTRASEEVLLTPVASEMLPTALPPHP